MAGFPGRKNRALPGGHNLIVDYFFGSGGYALSALDTNSNAAVVGAEANPRMAALHLADEAMRSDTLAAANGIARGLKSQLNPGWNGKGSYGELFPSDRDRLKAQWDKHIKTPFDSADGLPASQITALQAASQLLVSSLGFGCNIRVSGKGLNVPPNAQKVRGFRRIVPFPQIPNLESLAPTADDLQWEGDNAIALIDPPYVVPARTKRTHKLLTSCYPGHQPYGQSTWDLYWKTIARAMRSGARTIVVANYYTPDMDIGVSALSSAYNYRIIARNNFGAMTSQDMAHRYTHGKRSQEIRKLPHQDFEWILSRGKHRPDHDQGCLFFV